LFSGAVLQAAQGSDTVSSSAICCNKQDSFLLADALLELSKTWSPSGPPRV
jgi:hypothetical protein